MGVACSFEPLASCSPTYAKKSPSPPYRYSPAYITPAISCSFTKAPNNTMCPSRAGLKF